MSGRAPQRPPKNALKIRTESREEEEQVFEWMSVGNGFPFHVPVPVLDEVELYLSRDGRTLYGERFKIRIGREGDAPPIPSWDYQVTPAGDELARKRFAYPIVRSLWDYAPGVAARIGLRPRFVTISVALGGEIEGACPKCGCETLVEVVGSTPVGSHRLGTACAKCLTRIPR